MMGSQSWDINNVPPELKENLAELFPGLSFEEALQHQEGLYESLKIGCVNQTARVLGNGQSSSQSHSLGESSLSGSGDFNLDLDEALARSLQELDLQDEDDHAAISESVHSASSSTEHAAAGTSGSGATQDDVDPDRMTYEELQSLGETIGHESKGLTESEMSNLPCYKYKCGFFSKKLEIGECVICYSAYKNRQSVTSLPCLHQYHTDCINCWLKQHKTCPVCLKEVKFS